MNNAGEPSHNISGQQLSVNSLPVQTQECILFGIIPFEFLPMLEGRLGGLCDPGHQNFSEHEMSLVQKNRKTVIKIRRRFGVGNQNVWLMKYIGVPEGNPQLPVVLRKETNSLVKSDNMMEFIKSLGLVMDYEYIADGKIFTKGNVKVMYSKLSTSCKPGNYSRENIRKISDKALVEVSISLPESADYQPAAKEVREFADQLRPLVEMTKVECAAKYVRRS